MVKKNSVKGDVAAIIFYLAIIATSMAFWITVGWVVWHFISKAW